MARNEHFEIPATWAEASKLVSFSPVELEGAAGFTLQSLAVHVKDHKRRDLQVIDRTLEAYYGGFTFSQRQRPTVADAHRLVVNVSYGSDPRRLQIGGHEARLYEGDIDAAADDDEALPPVVVWHVEDIFHLLASAQLEAEDLLNIARDLTDR